MVQKYFLFEGVIKTNIDLRYFIQREEDLIVVYLEINGIV